VDRAMEVDRILPIIGSQGDELFQPSTKETSMICRECGAELAEGAAFCHQCGTRASDGDQTAPKTARQQFQAAAAKRQRNDEPSEDIVWQGQYSHLAMIGWWIAAGVATIVLLLGGTILSATGVVWLIVGAAIVVLWLALGLLLLYRQLSIRYLLTNQRIIHERGLLWRTTDRIELIDVDDVTYQQGPVERMLSVGNIEITSSDKTHPQLTISGIADVREVADRIDDLRRAERRRRGLHIESV
jgi:membrane protein YdbS with pleckstrin-like domain